MRKIFVEEEFSDQDVGESRQETGAESPHTHYSASRSETLGRDPYRDEEQTGAGLLPVRDRQKGYTHTSQAWRLFCDHRVGLLEVSVCQASSSSTLSVSRGLQALCRGGTLDGSAGDSSDALTSSSSQE